MFSKKHGILFDAKKNNTAFDMAVGFILGAVAASVFFISKAAKKENCSKKPITDLQYDDSCYEDSDGHDDYERARNGCNSHSADEEGDTDILHSCGCLPGYSHDDYRGFADSKGDRPNDLSNPELENAASGSHGNAPSSPMEVKNAKGKSNPQPENKITEAKRK